MYNFIIISLLFNLLFKYIFKPKTVTLNCGIWGFLGESARYFNRDKFNILGFFNDERGGDASGYLAGKNIQHLVGKDYKELAQEYILPSPRHNVVLGHTRKASSGGKLIEYTQPFCYMEEEKILGGLVHNGTLHNEIFLKNLYDVPKKFIYDNKEYDPNDTQVLAYILLKNKDFSVLEKYRGGAALIWEDREKKLSYIFKGGSKRYDTKTAIPVEERPLYTYTLNRGGIWVSSMDEPLWMIAEEKKPNIDEVPLNTILVVEKGVVVDKIPVDRQNGSQVKTYDSSRDWYGSDEYYDDVYGYNYGGRGYNSEFNKSFDKNNNNKSSGKIHLPIVPSNTEPGTIIHNFTVEASKIHSHAGMLQWASGRYYFKENDKSKPKLANGVQFLDCVGYPGKKGDPGVIPYYFIDGIMFEEQIAYQNTVKILKQIKKGKLCPQNCNSNDSMTKKRLMAMSYESLYPITNIENEKLMTTSIINCDSYPYTGEIKPLFNNNIYHFWNGVISRIAPDTYRYPDHKETIEVELTDKQVKSLKLADKDKDYTVLTGSCVDSVSNKLVLQEGEFYKLKEDKGLLIKYKCAIEDYGLNVQGGIVYTEGAEKWEEATEEEWLAEKKIYEDTLGNDLDADERKWYEEKFLDGASEKFSNVLKLLDDIESDAITENSIGSSMIVQDLITDIRSQITTSELNIK